MRTTWMSAGGLLWLATTAPAQVVQSFEDLPLRLNIGDTVVVDDHAGGSAEGRLVRLSPEEIAITGPGDRERVFARSDIVRVQKRGDSLGNGMKLGAIIGGAVGCAFAGAFSGEFRGGDCLAGALIFGGVGVGLGLAVDAIHVGTTTVFTAADNSHDGPIAVDDGRPGQSAPAPAAPQRPARPWTLSAVTGVPSTGPLDDLERTMRDTGFDRDSGGCVFDLCFASVSMPSSMHARAYRDSWSAGINRRIGTRLGVSVTGGRTLIGWTTGRHRASGAYLEIETAMTHVAPLVTFTPTPGLRVGAGPGVFSTTFTGTGLERQGLATTRRPGLLAEASLTFPRRSRLFAELSAQGRWLGRQPLGPIDVLPDGVATFPQSRVRVTHWFIGLGAGLRF